MANKRDLKKELNLITNELYSECLFIKFYEKEVDVQQADALLGKIAQTQEEFASRINHTDGKENPKLVKKYYEKLIADLDKTIGEIIDELEQLRNPAKQKS